MKLGIVHINDNEI